MAIRNPTFASPRADFMKTHGPKNMYNNSIMNAVFHYDNSERISFNTKSHGNLTLFRFLLHHCVIEIEFDRLYEPKWIVMKHKTPALDRNFKPISTLPTGYSRIHNLTPRQRRHRTLPNVAITHRAKELHYDTRTKKLTTRDAPIAKEYRRRRQESAPNWMGKPKRTMLCTLDEFVLGSKMGREVFRFSGDVSRRGRQKVTRRKRGKRAKGYTPSTNNTMTVWDLLWNNWREIPYNRNVTIKSIIPTSMGLKDLERTRRWSPKRTTTVFEKTINETYNPSDTQRFVPGTSIDVIDEFGDNYAAIVDGYKMFMDELRHRGWVIPVEGTNRIIQYKPLNLTTTVMKNPADDPYTEEGLDDTVSRHKDPKPIPRKAILDALPEEIVVNGYSIDDDFMTGTANNRLISVQHAIFQKIYMANFKPLTSSDRLRYMDGLIELNLHKQLQQLQKMSMDDLRDEIWKELQDNVDSLEEG